MTIVWEAADRICGKRLCQVITGLIDAMERHGHLRLDAGVKKGLVSMSAATMDRLLAAVRDTAKQGRRRAGINNTALRKSIAVRTFGDWNDPPPGFLEMDMVVHCGKSMAGTYVHSLVLTDIASGWTDAMAMVVREQTLVTESVTELRRELPFPVRGLDVDNDSAFINDTLVDYCRDNQIELTRCRAYKKNDQAWIEQKNGAVMANGGIWAAGRGANAAVLNQLYASARLFVNFFQPSFKLMSKTREGAKVIKKYHPPATPCERLLDREDVSEACKECLRRTLASLDPVRLLSDIREAQRVLAQREVGVANAETPQSGQQLRAFVAGLSTVWRDGEVRPTHRKRTSGPRTWRTRTDPLKPAGPRLSNGLTNNPTPMPRICSSACRAACLALSRLGNCELSSAGSNSGVVRSHASWCSAVSPRAKWTGNCSRLTLAESLPKGRVHEPRTGLQIDQRQSGAGDRAPALPRRASSGREEPISGTLSDPPRRRGGHVSRKCRTQYLPLFRVRRRWNGVGLRCCDGGLYSVRGGAKAGVDGVLVRTLAVNTERKRTGYRKKKVFSAAEVHANRHRLFASLSGRARNHKKDGSRVWRRFLCGAGVDASAIGDSHPQRCR